MRTIAIWLLLFVVATGIALVWRIVEDQFDPVIAIWVESDLEPESRPTVRTVHVPRDFHYGIFGREDAMVYYSRLGKKGSKVMTCDFPSSVPAPEVNRRAIEIVLREVEYGADVPSQNFRSVFARRFFRGPQPPNQMPDRYPDKILLDYRSESSRWSDHPTTGIAGRTWISAMRTPAPVPKSLRLECFRLPWNYPKDVIWASSGYGYDSVTDGREVFWIDPGTGRDDRAGCRIFELPVLPEAVARDFRETEFKIIVECWAAYLKDTLWIRASIIFGVLLLFRYRRGIARVVTGVGVHSSRALDAADRHMQQK